MSKPPVLSVSLGAVWALAGCGAADPTIDPDTLQARDLLGVDPEIVVHWSEASRDEARDALADALDRAPPDGRWTAPWSEELPVAESVATSLQALEDERTADGFDVPPVLVAQATVRGDRIEVVAASAAGIELAGGGDAPANLHATGWEVGAAGGWSELPSRGPAFLSALAHAAGLPDGEPVVVVPAPQAPFAAALLDGRGLLFVNPVLLAVLPAPRAGAGEVEVASHALALSGNPYSFYGSIGECAAEERRRCEDCLESSSCETESRDATDGQTECQTLLADGGAGAFALCVNLGLAIESVARCVEDREASCDAVVTAGNQLSSLDANAAFLEDGACRDALDACLAELYGAPDGEYPGPGEEPDGGPTTTPPPTRDVSSCNSDVSCDFSPQCDPTCSGGSCESGSCDDSCGSSCEGPDCSGCSSSSGDSGGSCDCGSGGDGGGGGGGGGGGSSSGDCSGGDCGGSCGGDCGSCGSSGCDKCSVAEQARVQRQRSATASVFWAALPVLVLGGWRSRERARIARGEGPRAQDPRGGVR